MTQFTRRNGLVSHPYWYKDAVIYELRTRSYFDSDDDGVGDIRGLTQKLPYLQDLGVTALWLLPLCPSPGRDDGYDISDYYNVHPDIGTLDDFRQFVEVAHKHGIRVITELVLNHTSDAHPWFQRARRAPPGSKERDFYVWSDTPELYKDARIIFKDFEPSNWTWDSVAQSYFWHRFFSHQPDLNFENEDLHQALFDVVDFWFGMGVDGLRLDAVPYLYEEDGTNCENLPRTHAFLKRLRAHVDSKFQNRMLLAEANQWPEDAAAYFGDGDECHMNFHFPIMPRLFMSIQMEDRFPIVDIMDQTPKLKESCQWAMFLRNHDELTLEMVTDEERDYMYRMYAHEPAMRINLGIRRRLAPLVGNDRRKMELLNGLLFSLPGTPVLYYGDEIGMGDNIFLGDRNGVRTPMQWSSDRNAGFSRTNPQRLILPVILDPEYHFESLNVEAQQNSPNSLLWWTKRLIALRKRYRAFGWGSIEFLAPSNPRVLAFIREHEGERILVVANLSRYMQYVELDLSKFKGLRPIELFGRTALPEINGETPYLLTLGEHAFYWFALQAPQKDERSTLASLYAPSGIESSSLRALCSGEDKELLEELLPAFVSSRSWFAGHGRRISSVKLTASVPLAEAPYETHLIVATVDYTEGEKERYALPVSFVTGELAMKVRAGTGVIATLVLAGEEGALVDALDAPEAASSVLLAIAQSITKAGPGVEVRAKCSVDPASLAPIGEASHLSNSFANVVVRFGNELVLKWFRVLEDGVHPDLDTVEYLAKQAPGLAPRALGSLTMRSGRAQHSTLAVLQEYVPNEGTAWGLTRRELERFYERALSQARDQITPEVPKRSVLTLAQEQLPPLVEQTLGGYQGQAYLLGQRCAELHLALASNADPEFAPEPYAALDRRSMYQAFRNKVGRVLRELRVQLPKLPASAQGPGMALLRHEREALDRLEPLLHMTSTGLRLRVHLDLNLKQALWTGKDFVLIDFDGGHDRALSERRRKRSPLRDVASMLLSFHQAAESALRDGGVRDTDKHLAEPWAQVWANWAAACFLRGYLETARGAAFLPRDNESLELQLERYMLARAFRVLGRELVTPDERVAITLQIILRILSVPLQAGS
jgi:maltose alpha-D-glucosyltransferase / alpha-amylase